MEKYIQGVIERGGPESADYIKLDALSFELWEKYNRGDVKECDLSRIRQALGDVLSPKTMHGFAYTKPRGYAGDFEMIDRIYQRWMAAEPDLARWDQYWHQHPTSSAIINRKKYFIKLLKMMFDSEGAVLNLGSGPGRDVAEYCQATPDRSTTIHCVDQDEEALTYAKQLCSEYTQRIGFEKANIIRYRPSQNTYDLVWAAGLFDYFNDDLFIRMAQRLHQALKPGGRMVIGNVSPNHRGLGWMLIYEWDLYYRSSEELLILANKICNGAGKYWVESEPNNINLFLHIEFE